MPAGRYRDVDLAITGHDFIATVTVSGSQEQASAQTKIGSFTIFDLTRQRLGRSTVLHLPDSDFRFLHFSIAGPIAPENVSGLSVERMPASEAKYQTVAETSQVAMKGRDTVIEFTVPSHTPVDRVVLVPGALPTSFSRDVRVSISPIVQQRSQRSVEPPRQVPAYGSFLRVHRLQDGHRLDEERLNILAPEAEFDTPATWTVTIENRDDAPIQVSSVRLEMLQRSLCFDASEAAAYTLHYGDPALAAPQYDYASLFVLQSNAAKGECRTGESKSRLSGPSRQPSIYGKTSGASMGGAGDCHIASGGRSLAICEGHHQSIIVERSPAVQSGRCCATLPQYDLRRRRPARQKLLTPR